MSSSRSSKSRKAEGSSRGPKETVNGNDGDSDVEEIEIDSDSEGDESSASDYKPKKQRECGFNKAAFSMPDDIKKLMERVTCCSCGKQLNPMNPGAVRKHPWLKVITCKKCYKFLRSGPFTRDDDGLDEQCRWCGEGGRLYGCDFCHNCFCRTCIKRNMGRTEAAIMENDDHSKWHCYMCKPKKISKLVDDCEKILGYIEKEEKKEKEREERAKQREKEKAEKYKEKRKDEKSKKTEEKESRKEDRDKKWEKEDKDEKSTPKRGLPAPRGKSEIAEKISSEKKDVEKSKGSIPQSKSMTDLIVVEDNPLSTFGPLQKHHRAVEYKPDTKSGVTLVQKASNGVTEVHVGPKNDKVVVVPFVNRNVGRAQNPLVMNYNNKPILAGMLTQQTRGLGKIMAPQNDIKALKNNIMPYNIENITERMANIAQSFSLTLNSAKTDLAIAKLSQPNMVLARQTAAAVVKNGFENFFSQVREVFNVQVVTNFPQVNVPDLNAQGDVKTVSGNLTSTPNAKKEPKNLLLDTVTGVLDESAIPIEIDEPSPVKKPGPMKEKMEVDVDEDSVVYVTDNESKEVKVVPLKDDKEEKEVNGIPEDVKDHAPELSKGSDEDKAKKNKTNENKDVKVDKSDGEVKTAENDETADTEDEVIAVSEEEETETRRGTRSANKVNDKEQKDKKDEERINEDSDSEDQGKVTRRSRSANKVNDKECSDKKDEEKNNEDSEVEEQGKVTRRSRKANKVNEKDKKDKVEDVDNEREEIEDHKEVEKKTKSSVSSKKGADKDEGDKNKTVDEESEKGKKSDKKGKNTSKGSDDEKLDENKKDKEEENEVNMDQSENTAAELELLKEMEEEFNAESDEPRRSLRRRKKDESESKDGSDNDSPVRRSSRQRQKPEEGKDTDKGDKKKGDSDSKKKKDKDESVEKDLSKDKKKKKVLVESDDDKTEENDDFDDDNSRASSAKDKKNSKSPKKSVNKSKLNIESEESNDTPKVKSKKDIKASKNEKEEKSSKNDRKVDDDDIPMEESDTTETSDSDESVAEFGKVKRRRKPVAKEETSRTTRQRGKKSEPSEPSDSDSDFDKDLEKEIKSLSKETRLSKKKAKEAKESKTEAKGKKEKPKEKETEDKKKGKKDEDDDDDNDDDSNSSEDEPEILSADDDSSDEDTDKVSASQLKKLKQTGKAILEDDSDEDYVDPNNISDDSSDPEISFPKLSTPKKGKRAKSEDLSDDSDFITPKKKRQRVKDKLLDAKVSDSDSDIGKKGKKGKGKKGKGKRKKDDSDQFSELSDEDENRPKGKGKKRKRIKKIDSSDEEGAPKEPGEDDNVGSGEEDGPGGFLKRKQIRKVKSTKKLAETTKAAQKAEEDRRKRIEERQKEYNTYVEVEGGEEEEEVPEGTEREMTTPTKAPDSIAKILGSPRKIPVTTKCVLEMDKETKKPLIEVDKTLIRKLKPHQVEAVRFMYNCCVESIERLKKGDGSGCILAHCMGLGKTLSVISFVHTMLRNVKLTKMSKCLVVCPLNTVLNWVNEFEIWLDDVDFEIEVYEMSKVKQNFERAQMLKEWHEGGAGVMILGYDMYRNLVNGSHCKNKKQKKIFYDSLADPGPDIVVCDEGHILKNDVTSLSKAMTKIKTPRRIVLTGTPLQNNLGEYHCMVSFVKPSLLGTRKEFNNRFNNPITNGQCSDSTPFDVKLMKRRAHILHELLAGCVQRKDYSALTKYLPPKFEYVISVRLSTVQMTLYEKYLDMVLGGGGVEGMKYKGARLFTDYQALMRIWTHPWVLKLDEIRQENKRMFDDEDEDSFIDDSNSEDDSFIDDGSTTSESNDDDNGDSDTSKKKKGKGKRKTRSNKKGSSSSDDDSKKEKDKDTGDEVVKKWTSKRRGNEEGAGSSWMMDMGYGNADEGPKEVTSEWWAEFVKEGDEFKLELSGKLTLMFEILKMCEDIGDKVLVFSQSLLSLDIIEDFLSKIDEANQEIPNADKPATSEEKPKEDSDKLKENGEAKADGEKTAGENPDGEKSTTEKTEKEKLNERLSHYGKSWARGADYFRMDGSTNSQNRKAAQDMFNDPENYRARLFLISTKAGSLGINLVAANRVIIFDASWNPSHDIQSIFRVYRFGQVKPVYVYRFLAQGTMEAKIYERQVTKQSLSQRVVDEHQIERHFTANDLQELYKFQPDRLDDPNIKERPLLALPKDHMLAELMTHNKEWIVSYHEHDSLLENVTEQELTEEEKKAAWEDYEDEKKGISRAMGGMNMNINPGLYATQQMNMQNLLLQGQANLGQAAVLQIVQDLKTRFPNLPPEVFQQRVQAVLRQVLTQQIMAQSEMQRRQVEAQRMAELQRLNQIKQQIQRQQAMINSQQRAFGMAGMNPTMNFGMGGSAGGMQMGRSLLSPQTMSHSNMPRPPSSASIAPMLPDQHKK